MGANSLCPSDITYAVAELFREPGPHLIDARTEAKRLLRLFPECPLTVEQLAEIIVRESVNHSGDAVLVSRHG